MSLWIKICANTSLEDALHAAEAGADAIGFVFAPSPRRVTVARVAEIVPRLPAGVEKIGVFVEASLDDICEAVCVSGITGVQLHAQGGPDLTAGLRERFGPGLRILRVVHFGLEAAAQASQAAADANVDAILVDSRTAAAVGGTGMAFDWQVAGSTLFGVARKPMVAAGGLTPDNVTEALATLRPWGVDVASGVESAPGRKDPAKVRAFIAHARAFGA
ncbi:MAG TPA: phosphoribosylanthranilate isomerase [Terracidiphilus sp.]|nr:phosphoribosylanthranilate isomerase [Terracidiphilus sp.]